MGDVEWDVRHWTEFVEFGGFEDIEMASCDLIRGGADLGLESHFVREYGHSAENEDAYEQDIHAHCGFDQGKCALGAGLGRLSHGLVVGRLS